MESAENITDDAREQSQITRRWPSRDEKGIYVKTGPHKMRNGYTFRERCAQTPKLPDLAPSCLIRQT